MKDVGIVLIGRNEAARLPGALAAALATGAAAVYVDSGSSDGSVAIARGLGAVVVELDERTPFCAARARNQGVCALEGVLPGARFVQFVDGDCELVAGWVEKARAFLQTHEDVAAVCGRRRERAMAASIYNRLMDVEWDTPVGEARACGGDAMFRLAAFRAAGGFDASVMAGEEPELCGRLYAAGWKIHRLDAEMTVHDADMHRLGQWLRRDLRTGYGSLDVARRFGDAHFAGRVRQARRWGLVFPAAGLLVIAASGVMAGAGGVGVGICLCLMVIMAQVIRLGWRKRRLGWRVAVAYGLLDMLGKAAQVVGQVGYWRDCARGGRGRLIEYKGSVRSVLRRG